VFGAAAGPSGRSDAAQSKIHPIANTSLISLNRCTVQASRFNGV
jgi:hypothetical protein